ncbi:peroxiredoxin [Cellvibrio zantedeschiae]|uniref:Peroxiredoxin n=1 Tax=Cellvibrio zantedeschiae TaxID=1237077 RepID=A0ABQ3AR21_9GAMM|nr:OsmC family protein [Cellvibrio zantedeschiae]GGY65149.1 peroxiredoxin [Cellvibrio zantedeschiae]
MTEHTAKIIWERGDQNFLDNRYSRKHKIQFDGGLEIPASSAPSNVPVPLSDESAADPEELLIAALSNCHMLWFLAIAAKRGFRVDSYEDDAKGHMAKNEHGKLFLAQVTLNPVTAFSGEKIPTQEELEQLHHKAHEECFIANSVLTEIICKPVLHNS